MCFAHRGVGTDQTIASWHLYSGFLWASNPIVHIEASFQHLLTESIFRLWCDLRSDVSCLIHHLLSMERAYSGSFGNYNRVTWDKEWPVFLPSPFTKTNIMLFFSLQWFLISASCLTISYQSIRRTIFFSSHGGLNLYSGANKALASISTCLFCSENSLPREVRLAPIQTSICKLRCRWCRHSKLHLNCWL